MMIPRRIGKQLFAYQHDQKQIQQRFGQVEASDLVFIEVERGCLEIAERHATQPVDELIAVEGVGLAFLRIDIHCDEPRLGVAGFGLHLGSIVPTGGGFFQSREP